MLIEAAEHPPLNYPMEKSSRGHTNQNLVTVTEQLEFRLGVGAGGTKYILWVTVSGSGQGHQWCDTVKGQ